MATGAQLRRIFHCEAIHGGFLPVNLFNQPEQDIIGKTMLLFHQRPQGFRKQQQPVNVMSEQLNFGLGFTRRGFGLRRFHGRVTAGDATADHHGIEHNFEWVVVGIDVDA